MGLCMNPKEHEIKERVNQLKGLLAGNEHTIECFRKTEDKALHKNYLEILENSHAEMTLIITYIQELMGE